MNYRRSKSTGASYFFTVNLQNRKSTLLTDRIEDLRNSFRKIQVRYPFEINAAVILPDHLHVVWSLPDKDNDFSIRWKLIKEHFTRSTPKGEYISTSRENKQERGIWQRRFWEHKIRNDKDMMQHISYIHYNPVKHGYCQHPEEWPYSSYHRDQKCWGSFHSTQPT